MEQLPQPPMYPFQGKTPKLDKSVFVAPGARIIGDVEIGPDASIWFNVVIRGDVHRIRIGEGTNIQDGSVLHVTHKKAPLTIGKNVTVGHMVILHGCTVRDTALIGMGAILLDGVEVGEESFVGAGSLLTIGTMVPPRSLVMGRPAKVVRPLRDDEIAFLHQSAENYKQYVRWYRGEGRGEGGIHG